MAKRKTNIEALRESIEKLKQAEALTSEALDSLRGRKSIYWSFLTERNLLSDGFPLLLRDLIKQTASN